VDVLSQALLMKFAWLRVEYGTFGLGLGHCIFCSWQNRSLYTGNEINL
jgi:hypothetical protein